MSETLELQVKHGERTLRQPCRKCGRKEGLYWWHDERQWAYDPHLPSVHNCTGKACAGRGAYRAFIMGDAYGNRHVCNGESEEIPSSEADIAEEEEATAEVPSTSTNGHAPSNDKIKLLEQLLGGLDESEVRRIAGQVVDKRIGDIGLPTFVSVKDLSKGTEITLPGQSHQVLPDVLSALDAGENVWLVGPAGTGKSTIAHQCAEALGIEFSALSLAPTTPLSAIFGYMDANGQYVETETYRRYTQGGVLCFDEMDNGHASILASVNMLLANAHCAFPNGMAQRHDDFRFVGTANTFGTGPDRQYVGRSQIDAATLDRFCTVEVPVDESLEMALAMAQGADADDVRTLVSFVRYCRTKAQEYKLPLVFSPRASIFGSKLLAKGFSLDKVVTMRVRKGISGPDWAKVTNGTTVPK